MRGGRGGGGGSGGLDAGNSDDPAAKYLRQVQNESRRAFNELLRSEEVAATVNGSAPKAFAAAPSILQRFIPALRAPPTLPADALPSADFVAFTVEHFDFVREYLTAARSAVVAARVTSNPRLIARCPSRPTNAPQIGASRSQWADFIARAVCGTGPNAAYGPPLGCFVFTDYVGTIHAVTVACNNLSRGGHTRQLHNDAAKRLRTEADSDSGSDASEGGSQEGSDGVKGDGPIRPAAAEERDDSPSVRTTTVEMDEPCEIHVTDANTGNAAALKFAFWTTRGGGGAWLFASLAAAHAPLDPDTQRVLQDAYASTVKHIRTIFTLRPDLFAGAERSTSAVSCTATVRRTWQVTVSSADLSMAEVRGMQTVLIVLGKIFKQANPALVPL